MLKNTTIAKVVSLILTLAIICPIITEVLPHAEALSPYTVVTTVKTTIRKDCYSDSKVLKNVKKGAELTIVSEKTNKYGNLWLGVKGGGYIYSEKCNPVLPALVTVDYYVKATKNTTVRSSYYSDGTKKVKDVKSGDVLRIVGEQTNKYYNVWLKVSDGGYIYSGNVQRVYDTSTSANFKIKTTVDTTARSKPYSDSSANSKLSAGTVLNVTAVITNCYNNLWYKTNKGYVYSGKASRVVDSVSPASYQVKVTNNTTLRVKPYKDEKDTRSVSKGTILTINGEVVNAHNNLWLRTSDNDFIYSGNIEKYTKPATSTSNKPANNSSSSNKKPAASTSNKPANSTSTLPEKPSGHTHSFAFTNSYEKAHPHYQILKCSLCSETKRGKTSKAKGCDKCHTHKYTSTGKYQSEHPHKLIEKCSCGDTRFNDKNYNLSEDCSSCKNTLASLKLSSEGTAKNVSKSSTGIYSFPDKSSNKLTSLKKKDCVKVLGYVTNKNTSWAVISYGGKAAYIPANDLSKHSHSYKKIVVSSATYKICNCGKAETSDGNAQLASVAVTAGTLTMVDGPFIPVGDLIAGGLVLGALYLNAVGALPSVDYIATAISDTDFANYLKKRPENVCTAYTFRKVLRTAGTLKYVDKYCMDMAEAYLYVTAFEGDVYTESEDSAMMLAAMHGSGICERDKDNVSYFYHYHLGTDRQNKAHIFFGANDLGNVPQ
ncbi:MAG: hypothetical protein IKU84_03510 [Clostridia bacterium]|nr:hypothetical protein [Clostridia bacterium]